MTNEKIMEKLDDFILGDMKKAMDEISRLRAENERLRRDVKTAIMGDSAELKDVKQENEKLREAVAAERERCARIVEEADETTRLYFIAAAIREDK